MNISLISTASLSWRREIYSQYRKPLNEHRDEKNKSYQIIYFLVPHWQMLKGSTFYIMTHPSLRTANFFMRRDNGGDGLFAFASCCLRWRIFRAKIKNASSTLVCSVTEVSRKSQPSVLAKVRPSATIFSQCDMKSWNIEIANLLRILHDEDRHICSQPKPLVSCERLLGSLGAYVYFAHNRVYSGLWLST